MIDIQKVSKSFINKTGFRTLALNNVSLKLPQKGLVFILGKSGSGKSTLLNLLGGLDSYDVGNINIKGHSTNNFQQKDLDSYRNGTVGFIFQDFNLIENMSVYENIALSLELQGKVPQHHLINNLLTKVEMTNFQNRKINELSGGQKQRVAIVRALIKDPEIILADEPTGNLDSETALQVLQILKELSQKHLVLIVSHDPENAYKFGDRVIEFKDGGIISDLSKTNNPTKKQKPQLTKGAVLTEEMIKLFQSQQKNPFKEDFEPTKEVFLDPKPAPFKQINSQLSLNKSFKIGANALKNKKVLLFFSIITLALVSFVFAVGLMFFVKINEIKKDIAESVQKEYYLTASQKEEIIQKEIKNLNEKIVKPILIVCPALTLIAFFLIYMYFNASIKLKKKEIGTLRALGAKGSTVSKIFFCEGYIYSSITSIFIVLFTIFGVCWFESKIEKNHNKSYFQIIIDFFSKSDSWILLSLQIFYVFALTFVAILLPIFKLSRKKPIDVLLNK
ncbi:ATP-binding cassette domain-containing protein [Candidatus Phytoplasma australiense]|uniref:ABC transporter ATP-binding protein n=1 Tax=Strawberry lethal yellows phytoplasma (CPA) str. NZSb11 TaxID=980422 RepID=R4RLN4_PHYAS|nr:ATP-binding cassette domain-containing protein [Candidatus Phytoplasma australiense]AGL90245.1 ABC transporter ATP-binding protein [Strawberry lethal yellows phytoplasma (CPA) str. NZSb11]